jgi:glutamate-ammonia-ligase adenylyltransferase
MAASPDFISATGGLTEELITMFCRTADPDAALVGLVRLAEAVPEWPPGTWESTVVAGDDTHDAAPDAASWRQRLVAVLGASQGLTDHLIRRPRLLTTLRKPGIGRSPEHIRARVLAAVGADADAPIPVASSADTVDDLRREYRAWLLRIAADDLTSADPCATVPAVSAALADLAAATVEGALAVARAQYPEHATAVLAVIGLGKTGGRELNYVSDVDVLYVCDADEAAAGTSVLAAALQRVSSAPSAEPAIWDVDAALRPEGKAGPLTRTLESHVAYMNRWAENWEFQALLKARPIAGNRALGERYCTVMEPYVWSAASREGFVHGAHLMRRRVEAHIRPTEVDREIKLGRGGLRDMEFSVQLLQLVHGRTEPTLRTAGTLDGAAALAAAGFIGRDQAEDLAECYRFERALEHRVQLWGLRRTHLMPTSDEDLRRVARGLKRGSAQELVRQWQAVKRQVRGLHEALFYRPLLPAYAQLSPDDIALEPAAALERLAAMGYRNPQGAVQHIAALTSGTSRRATLQRHLLPLLLGWFARGADPDEGLLAFRRLSDELGGTHWYLKLLRDSGTAAEELAQVLSNSRYVAEAIERSPDSVQWFDDHRELQPRGLERLTGELGAIIARAEVVERAIVSLRALRRRELARTAAGELLGQITRVQAAGAISDAADVSLSGALYLAQHEARVALSCDNPTRMAVIAMGRLGGRELGYGSDADVLFVHEPLMGADPGLAARFAQLVASRLRVLLGSTGAEPPLPVDADLRPEGRNGPLARTLESYAEYYARWSSVWEAQALLRARPVAGDADLGERFIALVNPLRYRAGGLAVAEVREIRRIKARVEAERLPRGVEPQRHLKLGPGGIADVEWAAQLLQLQNGADVVALQTTSTPKALSAALKAGLMGESEYRSLKDAWVLASRLRSARVLWTGRATGSSGDVLPHDRRDLAGMAAVLGDVGTGADLENLYLRTARRSRAAFVTVFQER